MKAQPCAVKECGAVVYLLPLESGEIAVDPQPLAVVVPDGERFRIVTAYQPHWTTCVDISARGRRRRQMQT
jgi:hypothetical protein